MDKRYQVFISSTYADLQEERQVVIQALLELDCIPAGMELFPAASEDQWTLIKQVIDDCDYYMVIVAGRYGSIGPDSLSYTEMEYRYALDTGKPIIGFIHRNPGALGANRCESTEEGKGKLSDFRDFVQKKMCRFWESPADLGSKVSRDLVKLIKNNPGIGWVRGDLVADEIATEEILGLRRRNEELEQELLASRRHGPEVFDFFGGSCKDMDFHLVCSKRILTNHTSRYFEYPYAERLLINPIRVKQRDKNLSIPWSPLPKGVKGWLAYEDMIVASRMGKLFGEMCGRQVQIDLDKDDDHWADNPTIAVGLGFTWHTRKLLEASGLINVIGIDWSEQEPITDSFLFDGKPYCDRQDSYDYALVARVLTGGSNVHFICAGRTAPGTAAAGRYLQERWSDIAKLYVIPQEMNKKSVAVLIKHPHQIEIVCSGRVDLIEYVSHVFA
jgi:hypothetical protein